MASNRRAGLPVPKPIVILNAIHAEEDQAREAILVQWQIAPDEVHLEKLIDSMADMTSLYLTCTSDLQTRGA